jgi:hypothetical protein
MSADAALESRDQAACLVCGDDLSGRRRDALTCSGACRAERSRLRRLLAGGTVDGWDSVEDRLQSRRKRTVRRSRHA